MKTVRAFFNSGSRTLMIGVAARENRKALRMT